MRTYEVTLHGMTPLLMHADNIEWADAMEAWKNSPGSRKKSKAGDDRTPAFRWLGCLYHDGEHVGVPQENLMRCLMEGGVMVPVPGGRGGKTFKAQTQSGCMVMEGHWPLVVGGDLIPVEPLLKLEDEPDFAEHQRAASEHGFSLFVKRVRVSSSKHIRVRPRFDSWSAAGTIRVMDEQITEPILQDILTLAGQYKGLGDWRPSSRTPGWYGRFRAEVKEL